RSRSRGYKHSMLQICHIQSININKSLCRKLMYFNPLLPSDGYFYHFIYYNYINLGSSSISQEQINQVSYEYSMAIKLATNHFIRKISIKASRIRFSN